MGELGISYSPFCPGRDLGLGRSCITLYQMPVRLMGKCGVATLVSLDLTTLVLPSFT